jgi:hypothetical protein
MQHFLSQAESGGRLAALLAAALCCVCSALVEVARWQQQNISAAFTFPKKNCRALERACEQESREVRMLEQ